MLLPLANATPGRQEQPPAAPTAVPCCSRTSAPSRRTCREGRIIGGRSSWVDAQHAQHGGLEPARRALALHHSCGLEGKITCVEGWGLCAHTALAQALDSRGLESMQAPSDSHARQCNCCPWPGTLPYSPTACTMPTCMACMALRSFQSAYEGYRSGQAASGSCSSTGQRPQVHQSSCEVTCQRLSRQAQHAISLSCFSTQQPEQT